MTRPAVFVLLALALSSAALLAAGSHSPSAPPESAESSFYSMLDASMLQMHDEMEQAARTGDPDHDFLTMMIPHHVGAVEAARSVLLYGRDPQVRRLAKEVLAEQALEVEYMQRLLKTTQ